jgi:hypothetical protein
MIDRQEIQRLLRAVRQGRTDVAEAAERLASLGTGNLGFARIDHHRRARRGMPEVIYGEGKSTEHVLQIAAHLADARETVLATRIGPETGASLVERLPQGCYDPLSRTFLLRRSRRRPRAGLAIISAGTSDLPVAEEAAVTAEALDLAPERLFDVGVAGLHRLLESGDVLRRARVLIVVAGMEGALPSVVAGLVEAPVIGVPTSVGYGVARGGYAALAAMLTSCAGGVTVVNIDNGFGAACAARSMLALARRSK